MKERVDRHDSLFVCCTVITKRENLPVMANSFASLFFFIPSSRVLKMFWIKDLAGPAIFDLLHRGGRAQISAIEGEISGDEISIMRLHVTLLSMS